MGEATTGHPSRKVVITYRHRARPSLQRQRDEGLGGGVNRIAAII